MLCHWTFLSQYSQEKKEFLSHKRERDSVFAVPSSPVPEKEILDFIAHGSIIQVFTVFENYIWRIN